MADDGNITIELNLETGQFTSSLKTAQDGLAGFGKGGEGVGETSTKFLELNAMLELASKAIEGVKIVWDQLIASSVDAAVKQEQSSMKMNEALASNGLYTTELSDKISEYGEHLSRTTTISVEQTNQAYQLAAQYSKNEDQLNKLATAALNYSNATGKDLTMSMRALGGSLEGTNAGLNRILPGFKEVGFAALTAGAALDEVNRRYGGTAGIQAQTFSGHLTMMKNAWEELHVSIGKAITQSPEINRIIELITKAIHSATDSISSFVKSGGINDLIKATIQIGTTFATNVIGPLEILGNVGTFVFKEIVASVDMFIAIVTNAGVGIIKGLVDPFFMAIEQIGSLVMKFKPELGKGILDAVNSAKEPFRILEAAAQSTTDVMKESAKEGGDALKHMFETPWADKAVGGIQKFTEAMKGAKAPIHDLSSQVVSIQKPVNDMGAAFKNIHDGMIGEVASLNKNFASNFQNMGKSMVQGFGHAAANAFASFGKAIAEGKDALSEFGKAVLAALGNQLVSMGSAFMLQGIAMTWAELPNGPPLIAAGAGLAAFGGLLSGLGGGGNSSYAATASGGSAAAGGSAGGQVGTTATTAMQPQQNAQIVINGDFLNSSETANHLTDILRQNSDVTNYTITAQGKQY